VELATGVYGDLAGNLDRMRDSGAGFAVVVIEWSDLDPRLGLRSLADGSSDVVPDILETVRSRCLDLAGRLEVASSAASLVISLPTLPLPPVATSPRELAGALEPGLSAATATFAVQVAQLPRAKIVSPDRLGELSPSIGRLDVKSELRSGFPYTIAHASVLAELISRHIAVSAPKKALITDLDDTLWRGILGEDGVDSVSWDLDRHSHMHAVYQRLLHALSKAGVLVGVATRNDPDLVAEALKRSDLLLKADRMFPVVADWGPKSIAVESILKKWNLGPESVVFVDDSAMELAEVQNRFPEITCLLYPTRDDPAVHGLLETLRDLFGKASIGEEDRIRLESLRRADTAYGEGRSDRGNPEDFLKEAGAVLTIRTPCDPNDPRPLELVNKTNQFNLNGRRFTQEDWLRRLAEKQSVSCVVSYRDKFGPLGAIAVVAGRRKEESLELATWVMSCRAFGRRIEHAVLRFLFDQFGAREIVLECQPTDRNGPLREFLGAWSPAPLGPAVRIERAAFQAASPPLYHTIEETPDG
jgi:FkbH-like protein